MHELAKERSSLEDTVDLFRQWRELDGQRRDAQGILDEGGDTAMMTLAEDEVAALDERLLKLRDDLEIALLPQDPNDSRDVIVEVRAGAGGP